METKESRMERYYWCKDHGICVNCGKQPAFYNHTLCPDCMEQINGRTAKYRMAHREQYNRAKSIQRKSAYYQRKEAGICTNCGKRPAKAGRAKCEICLSRNAAFKREASGRAGYPTAYELRIDRRDAGLCMDCGKPAAPGYCFCEDCLAPRRAHGKKIGGHGYMRKAIEGDVRLARAKGGRANAKQGTLLPP